MCAPVNFPLHRYGQHLPTDDGEKISRHIKIEVGKAKGGVGVVRWRTNWRNSLRRLVVIHESVRVQKCARERLASRFGVAREVLNNERARSMHVIPSASEGPRLNSWITQANLGIQHCTREVPHLASIRGSG